MIVDLVQEGLRAWWAPALAFAAGVVSFASPCVLPLVPGYLAFITVDGALAVEGGSVGTRARARAVPILLFVLGFSVVFTLVGGFTATSLSRWLKSTTGQRVAGVVVLAFGVLMVAYAVRLRVAWLYREGRPFLTRVRPGPAAAFPLGMAFAVGWTPCIGPVLGGILTLAAAQGGGRSLLLLLFYSLGLGLPFLLVGLGLGGALRFLRPFSRHYRVFAGVSGAALVIIGGLLLSGAWTRLTAPLFEMINRFTPPI